MTFNYPQYLIITRQLRINTPLSSDNSAALTLFLSKTPYLVAFFFPGMSGSFIGERAALRINPKEFYVSNVLRLIIGNRTYGAQLP